MRSGATGQCIPRAGAGPRHAPVREEPALGFTKNLCFEEQNESWSRRVQQPGTPHGPGFSSCFSQPGSGVGRGMGAHGSPDLCKQTAGYSRCRLTWLAANTDLPPPPPQPPMERCQAPQGAGPAREPLVCAAFTRGRFLPGTSSHP